MLRLGLLLLQEDDYIPDINAKREAQKGKINLDIVPLSSFSTERIEQVRKRYCVYGETTGLNFSDEAEKQLGPLDRYLEMLPYKMQTQINKNIYV